jgi:hypothetical protein
VISDVADRRTDWPDDLCEIVYVDHFGNAMTGLRAQTGHGGSSVGACSDLQRSAGRGGFLDENSNGLGEIAVN